MIHTDFEKSFISAEVIGNEDLNVCGSFAKRANRESCGTEGRKYVMQDCDVVEFKTFL